MTKLSRWTALAMVLTAMVGCVGQTEVDNLRKDNDALRDEIVDLKTRIRETQATIDALRQAPPKQDPELLAALEQARQRLEAQKKQYEAALAAAQDRIRKLANMRVAGPNALPQEIDEALVDLAEKNPGLMTYDRKRGMVKISSDLTFDLGKTTLKPGAVDSLKKLAAIFQSEVAQRYAVRIVGHTDNVPVTNPRNKAKYESNWGLSAFRAIAVMEVLRGAGVSPVRMSIVGQGEYHPAVPNGPKGTPANRRVEIYLVPMTYEGPGEAGPEPAGGSGAGSGAGEGGGADKSGSGGGFDKGGSGGGTGGTGGTDDGPIFK